MNKTVAPPSHNAEPVTYDGSHVIFDCAGHLLLVQNEVLRSFLANPDPSRQAWLQDNRDALGRWITAYFGCVNQALSAIGISGGTSTNGDPNAVLGKPLFVTRTGRRIYAAAAD